MADLSDVEQAILNVVSSALYPDGPDQTSALGTIVRIYRGWPAPGSLNTDLAAGRVNITVYPDSDPGRDTTRFDHSWNAGNATATATISVSGTQATLGGTMDQGQVLGLLVDGAAYAYRTAKNDTPALVASIISTQIAVDRPAQYSGTTLTVPGAHLIKARVVVDASVQREVRRQERNIRIAFWCPTPLLRDAAAPLVDGQLSTLPFINLADGTVARIRYGGSQIYDNAQNAQLYRRDLIYISEYATISSTTEPRMLFGHTMINDLGQFA
jgi:hypothetical protein